MTAAQTVHLWPGYAITFNVERELIARQTPFQRLSICDTETFGRALFLDGKIQSAERDEHIYHESLVHPALLAHPGPRSVFIAGGGEGATLREVLRQPSVRRAVMVDIDPDAVDFARQHLHAFHRGAFDDPRAEVVIGDARAALDRTSERFDAIVVDVTDPIAGGPAYLLFTLEFYRIVREHLNPGGILSLQAESAAGPIVGGHAAIVRTLREAFPIVRSYSTFVPAFGEPWGFAIASDAVDPASLEGDVVDARIAQRGLTLRHYDGISHRHMFASPRYVREAIAGAARPITDASPFIAY